MNKKKKIVLFSLMAFSCVLIFSCAIGLLINDSSRNTEDVSTSASSNDAYSKIDYDSSAESDVIVNNEVEMSDISVEENVVLHGWVINNMGYTYFYKDSAYQQFNFKTSALERYTNSVNNLSECFSENTKIYNIIAPVSSSFANIPRDVYTTDNFYNTSQSTFVSTAASKFNDKITNISITSQLEEQYDNGEYVFFRSDKNWTALGAYTAYRELCASLKIKPHDLSEYETFVIEEHLGTYYNALSADKGNINGVNYSNVLAEKPDSIVVYKPLDNVKTVLTVYDLGLVYDNYKLCNNSVSSSNAYDVFLGKPAERYELNTNVGDESVLIIGDESAFPLVSFLSSHYRKIDVINPMRFNGNLEEFLSQRYYDICINICYSTNAVSGEYIPKLNTIIGDNNG